MENNTKSLWGAGVIALLVVANIAAFVWLSINGVDAIDPNPEHLIAWGGNVAPLTLNGDAWRLFTSMFLHSGLVHLFANMSMLLTMAPHAIQRIGVIQSVLVYLGGGLLASLASAAWYSENLIVQASTGFGYSAMLFAQPQIQLTVGVGASGGLMALCGALAASGLFKSKPANEPPEDSGAFYKSLGIVIGINLLLGLVIPGVDQAAHVGGLSAGFILGLLLGSPKAPATWIRTGVAAIACAGVLAWGLPAANTLDAIEVAEKMREEKPAGNVTL